MCDHLKICGKCQEYIAEVIADTVSDMCEADTEDQAMGQDMDINENPCDGTTKKSSRQLRELPRPTPVVMSSAGTGMPRSRHSRSRMVPHMERRPIRSTTSQSSLASTTLLPREQPRSPEKLNGQISMTTTESTWSNST